MPQKCQFLFRGVVLYDRYVGSKSSREEQSTLLIERKWRKRNKEASIEPLASLIRLSIILRPVPLSKVYF